MTDLRTLPGDVAIMVARITELEAEVERLRASVNMQVNTLFEFEYQFNSLKAKLVSAETENAKLVKALTPFAAFAGAGSFDRLPDDMPMTQGSHLARQQVTAGDFKRARAALGVTP